jgi:hypothetical protein
MRFEYFTEGQWIAWPANRIIPAGLSWRVINATGVVLRQMPELTA